jgi:hypothetical protein
MVEGDIALGADELEEYFEAMPQPGALTVITDNNIEMRWGIAAKYDLSYCIDDNIGTNKQQVVDAMNAAARAWEQVAEVRFVYVPSQDSSCDANNTSVLFNVRIGDCGSSCQASAFFPGDSRSEREVLIDSLFWNPSAPYTQVGILTHELGHILGFRHEHIWTSCTTEGQVASDGRSGAQLTPTDNASVMFYLWCGGATHTNGYQISEQDALGAACKYNESIPRSACDVNRNGTDGIWRSNGAARTWAGQTYSLGSLYHPIAGDFDGDGNDDILFYGRGTRSDFI